MKKNILLYAIGGSSWIGGVYYIKNIAYQLISNPHITENYGVIILTTRDLYHVFDCFEDNVEVIIDEFGDGALGKIKKFYFYLRKNVRFVFPQNIPTKYPGVNSIAWIPDFQHNNLPEMFTDLENERRSKTYSEVIKSSGSLVLSSNSSLNDLRKFYGNSQKKIYVVPFVSYIERELNSITDKLEKSVLASYGLFGKKYVYIGNQFWKHKNHMVVLQAIDILVNGNDCIDMEYVFTGELNDYRNPEYIQQIKKYFDRYRDKPYLKLLGYIDRIDQLIIMKNAEYIVQPSLFEGWGTVLEDAKVLDKTVILSDITIHREQMNDKCILFNPYDPHQLAKLMADENRKTHDDNQFSGIENMKLRAYEYSIGFERLLVGEDD